MSVKQPTTAHLPDFERLSEQLLERRARLTRVAATLREIGGDSRPLVDDLLELGVRLNCIDQMRRVAPREDFPQTA